MVTSGALLELQKFLALSKGVRQYALWGAVRATVVC